MSEPFEKHVDLLQKHGRRLESLEESVGDLSKQLNEWRPFFKEEVQSIERHVATEPQWTIGAEECFAAVETMQHVLVDLEEKFTHLVSEISAERLATTVAVEELRTKYSVTERLSDELKRIGDTLTRFMAETRSTIAATTSQQRVTTFPVLAPVVSPTIEPTRDASAASGSSVLRWSRRLGKIEYREVKNFTKQFTDFVSVTKMCDDVATLLLLQQLDGTALTFAESTQDKSWKDVLRRMAERVKPSRHVVLNELVSCKQNRQEKIRDFALRFHSVLDEHPDLSDGSPEIRAILIVLLTLYWQATARSIVFHNPDISVEHLLKGMTDIEGPGLKSHDCCFSHKLK